MDAEWSRAYQPSAGRWAVIVWEAGGLGYLQWTSVQLFDLSMGASWLLASTFTVLWIVGSWRIINMGLYLSNCGLLISGIVRNRTIAWESIERMSVEDVTYRLGPLHIPAGKSVIFTLRNGDRVNASMWEKGMDFHSRPQVFRMVCHDLRSRISSASVRS